MVIKTRIGTAGLSTALDLLLLQRTVLLLGPLPRWSLGGSHAQAALRWAPAACRQGMRPVAWAQTGPVPPRQLLGGPSAPHAGVWRPGCCPMAAHSVPRKTCTPAQPRAARTVQCDPPSRLGAWQAASRRPVVWRGVRCV